MSLSVNDIAKLSGTYWDHNPNLLKSLCAQKVDYTLGWFLLLLSFFLQTWNFLWPMRINDFGIDKNGLIIGILFSFLVFGSAFLLARVWAKQEILKAEKILEESKK